MLLISSRPWCAIRVIPDSFSPGFLGGSFELMEYANHGPVAYVENQTHSLFLENRDDIHVYREILAKLKAITLDEGQSRGSFSRVVGVRDSKDSGGPVLRFSPAQWRAFTARPVPRP
jgi:uncharacterized protein DUF5753/uncharacterized protein DUF397